ncbi:MAG: hypothetical protein R3E42_06850 [Burkholderiaceae bacterium]
MEQQTNNRSNELYQRLGGITRQLHDALQSWDTPISFKAPWGSCPMPKAA